MVLLPVIEEDMVEALRFSVDEFRACFSAIRDDGELDDFKSTETIDCFPSQRTVSQVSDDLTAVYAVSIPCFLRQRHRSNPAARSASVNSFGWGVVRISFQR